jgi:hypothetical protein
LLADDRANVSTLANARISRFANVSSRTRMPITTKTGTRNVNRSYQILQRATTPPRQFGVASARTRPAAYAPTMELPNDRGSDIDSTKHSTAVMSRIP